MSEERRVVWRPDEETIRYANLTKVMHDLGFASYDALYRWSIGSREDFWEHVADRLGIVFVESPERPLTGSPLHPRWFPGARMNIVDSCFTAPEDRIAVVYRSDGEVHRMTYGELRSGIDRFADGMARRGIGVGDRVAIAMPMTIESVIAYLGIVATGAVVVSIADSFAPDEIARRLEITGPVLIVTRDRFLRAGKDLPMYDKIVAASGIDCVVVDTESATTLRPGDVRWEDFLGGDGPFPTVAGSPDAHMNILFSSGTTGEPKAIPWTHLTPIKCAMDGWFHHDIHPEDTVAWPTNLGWMLGPWLIYVSLINGATMALYDDVPTGRGFIEFVGDAGVTVLGLVPSIVAAWRSADILDDGSLTGVRVLSSSGEASVPADYAWLMETVGAPVIEYCGGTEIGGGFLIGTVLDDAVPAEFTTPTLGTDLRILDEDGRLADEGELFVVPPVVGLSSELLNRDHDAVYYEGVPAIDVPLRRHGDHMQRLPGGRYRALGRVDDTMNLGGIKISSAELERSVSNIAGVAEVAAVAVPPPGGGPDRLVIYAVPVPGVAPDPERWRAEMQAAIRSTLNPLFRVDRVIAIDELPRTASAKVMRRELRSRLM